MPKFQSTKFYGHDRGLSCCFRQWRATHSHCSTLHGYSIGIKLVFESETLDDRNWAFDFGGLKIFKQWADNMFDHTLIIAEDDPELEFFKAMAQRSQKASDEIANEEAGLVRELHPHEKGAICDLRIVPGVGCEMFAKMAYERMEVLLWEMKQGNYTRYPINQDVRLVSVEVMEHSGNSAVYLG